MCSSDLTTMILRGEWHSCAEATRVYLALGDALDEGTHFDPGFARVIAMQGMSGLLYRRFINRLIGLTPDARYLEVGSWTGSTACAAMQANKLKVTCIDNWSEFQGPRDIFLRNVERCRNRRVSFDLIESDFHDVDYGRLGPYNVYLFDGPHTTKTHLAGIRLALPALDDRFILIVDDWNWQGVRHGTCLAIAEANLTVHYSLEVLTTQDDTHPEEKDTGKESAWHNGYFVCVCTKPGVATRPKAV